MDTSSGQSFCAMLFTTSRQPLRANNKCGAVAGSQRSRTAVRERPRQEGHGLASDLYERNQDIGRALERARKRAKKSIKQCAEVLGTSWRRYREIERGTVFVTAVELEALVSFLSVPPHEVWPTELITAGTRRVVVTIEEGESVQVLVTKSPAAEGQGNQ